MSESAQQQLGKLAAQALDDLEDSGQLIGAVLLVVERDADDPEIARTLTVVPEGQVWPMTLGIVETWRQETEAEIIASAVVLEFEDDGEED